MFACKTERRLFECRIRLRELTFVSSLVRERSLLHRVGTKNNVFECFFGTKQLQVYTIATTRGNKLRYTSNWYIYWNNSTTTKYAKYKVRFVDGKEFSIFILACSTRHEEVWARLQRKARQSPPSTCR
jgi:hypothetical protein